MKIEIDGRSIEVTDASKNIVEIADENGITIPAPCFRMKERKGCCKGCAIIVDGKLKYACGVKPVDGMDIKVKTTELMILRNENISKYKANLEQDNVSSCGCNCSCSDDCC